MQWHPDRNANDPAAADNFKRISEAYEVLSDESKRQEYDAQSSRPFGAAGGRQTGFGTMDDFLSQFFGQHGFAHFHREPPRNRDVSLALNISLEDAFAGRHYPLSINTPSGRRVDLMVNIPAGIEHGVKIRYQGQGDHANTSLPPGDLYININIAEHDKFKRNGSTLETRIQVDCLSALVGGRATVSSIDGQQISLMIQAGMQHGTRIRIPGRGMPLHPGSKDRGDMMVIVELLVPTDLTAEMRANLIELQKKRGLDTL